MVEKMIFTLQESCRHIIFLPVKSSLYFLSLSIYHFLLSFLYLLYLNLNSHYPYNMFLFPYLFFSLTLFFFINIKFIRGYLKLNHNEIKLVKKLKANPAYIRKPLTLTSFTVNFSSLLLVINLIRYFYNKKDFSGLALLNLDLLFFSLFLISTIILTGIVHYLSGKEFI